MSIETGRKTKNSSIFQKNVYEQRSPPTQITHWSKKCRIRLMRSVIIQKASQDKQQNQTTITTVETKQAIFGPQKTFK